MKGRVLIIAGSDPSGGAGVQADIKTVTALGGYAAAALTALTVQNTKGVSGFEPVSPEMIRAQIDAVMEDVGADVIKIGMIGDKKAAYVIAEFIEEARRAGIPTVLDPVLGATSGDSLAGDGVAAVVYHEMLPRSALITPNADELAVFAKTGPLATTDDMLRAGRKLQQEWMTGPLLLKGGHIAGEEIVDILLGSGSVKTWRHPRINTTSTHGTGCTLASACAAGLAQGLSLADAVERAIAYVQAAIRTAPGYGGGRGPLNHAHTVKGA